MSSARNKRMPSYSEYISYSELVSMFNACVDMVNSPSWNYRIFATSMHLVLEVTLKKMAILYGRKVSLTSHSTGALIVDLKDVDAFAGQVFRAKAKTGTLRQFQKFPYDDLRFNSTVNAGLLVNPVELTDLTRDALRRLEYLENSPLGKKLGL